MKLLTTNIPGDFLHFCPGCDHLHQINTSRKNHLGAQWRFDGNIQQPSFSPSVNIDLGKKRRCHYTISAGQVTYHSDTTHEYVNKTIVLPDIPDYYIKDVN